MRANNLGRALAGIAFAVSLLASCAGVRALDQPATVQRSWEVTPDLQVEQIADGVWMHTSWRVLADGTRFPSNGLLVRDGESLVLVDTAWGEGPTAELLSWAEATLRLPVAALLATHFHDDRLGGATVLSARRIPLYGHPLTAAIAASEKLGAVEPLQELARIGSVVRFRTLEVFYPGPGHTRDNIMVWLPRQRILFGGCAVRALSARTAGNTADADPAEWPRSVERALKRYGSALTVVPGHGDAGDAALLRHTIAIVAPAS